MAKKKKTKTHAKYLLLLIPVILISLLLIFKFVSDSKKTTLIQEQIPVAQKISGSWVLSGSQTKEGWKTYEHPGVKMKISVPESYEVENPSGVYVAFHPPYKSKFPEGISSKDLKIEIYTQPDSGETLEEWYNKSYNQAEVLNKENIILDGVPAIRNKWKAFGTGESIYLIHNGATIGVSKYPAESDHQSEFEEIVSTIEFN